MYATSMGHWLTQSSRALVLKAREAGENCAYSLYMLARLRLDFLADPCRCTDYRGNWAGTVLKILRRCDQLHTVCSNMTKMQVPRAAPVVCGVDLRELGAPPVEHLP
jgi:hypothetical protein